MKRWLPTLRRARLLFRARLRSRWLPRLPLVGGLFRWALDLDREAFEWSLTFSERIRWELDKERYRRHILPLRLP